MRSRSGDTDDSEPGQFLRARRAALDPRRAGPAPGDGVRRVAGLRREELAQLAHLSFDYVVRLEQGRTRRVSTSVLSALADALQLTQDERAYLHSLADVAPRTAPRPRGRPEIAPPLQRLIDDMHDVPAMMLHRRMDILAWNRAAAALLFDFGTLPPRERDYIRPTVLNEDFRNLYVDWPTAARECVGVLRREAGQHRDDRDLNDLVAELEERSAQFREWWADYRVAGPRQFVKTLHHPTVGRLTVDLRQLTVDTNRDQFMATLTGHDTESRAALRFLRQWSSATDRTEFPVRPGAAGGIDSTAPERRRDGDLHADPLRLGIQVRVRPRARPQHPRPCVAGRAVRVSRGRSRTPPVPAGRVAGHPGGRGMAVPGAISSRECR